MHIYRKIIAILLFFTCIQFPIASAVSINSENSTSSVINVTSSEFNNNLQYYKDLAKNSGAIIIIDTSTVDPSIIEQEIDNRTQFIDELTVGNSSRSTYIPSSYWNVATQGSREISGSSSGPTLYTSVKYYGLTSYELFVYNNHSECLNFTTIGDKEENLYAVSPGCSIFYDITTYSTSKADAFYVAFTGPCDIIGMVSESN